LSAVYSSRPGGEKCSCCRRVRRQNRRLRSDAKRFQHGLLPQDNRRECLTYSLTCTVLVSASNSQRHRRGLDWGGHVSTQCFCCRRRSGDWCRSGDFTGARNGVRRISYEACRFPILIPECPSVDSMELSTHPIPLPIRYLQWTRGNSPAHLTPPYCPVHFLVLVTPLPSVRITSDCS